MCEKMFMHYFIYGLFSYISAEIIVVHLCLCDAEIPQEDDGGLRFS